MLYLTFCIDNQRYALDARAVLEVVPMVTLRRVDRAPASVAGLVNYRGKPVPVLDICQVIVGRRARLRLSTRIAILELQLQGASKDTIGVILEGVSDTRKIKDSEFVAGMADRQKTPFLGDVAVTGGTEILQRVDIRGIVDAEVLQILLGC